VTVVEGEALAKKLGAAFVESSAKDNKNVGKSRLRGLSAFDIWHHSRRRS